MKAKLIKKNMAFSNQGTVLGSIRQKDEYTEVKLVPVHFYESADEVLCGNNEEAEEEVVSITSILNTAGNYTSLIRTSKSPTSKELSNEKITQISNKEALQRKYSNIHRCKTISSCIQKKWLNILAIIVNVILLVCVLYILAEFISLRKELVTQNQQSPSNASLICDLSTLEELLDEHFSHLNLDNLTCPSNASRGDIQPMLCPFCDYCRLDRGERNCSFAKVAELDLSNNNTSCPSEFTLRVNNSVRTSCDSTRTSPTGGCTSVLYYTNMTYSKVYGRITAYQYGFTNSFQMFRNNRGNQTIDEAYVDGVSLTYGMPRQHIWTFAADRDKSISFCPCGNNDVSIPPFVGRDYFCDAGEADMNTLSTSRLWDGRGCDGSYSCCSYNSPPWFYKQLPYPTSEPIELRVCTDQSTSNENIELESILIYVLS